jgi:hypothetical protein
MTALHVIGVAVIFFAALAVVLAARPHLRRLEARRAEIGDRAISEGKARRTVAVGAAGAVVAMAIPALTGFSFLGILGGLLAYVILLGVILAITIRDGYAAQAGDDDRRGARP